MRRMVEVRSPQAWSPHIVIERFPLISGRVSSNCEWSETNYNRRRDRLEDRRQTNKQNPKRKDGRQDKKIKYGRIGRRKKQTNKRSRKIEKFSVKRIHFRTRSVATKGTSSSRAAESNDARSEAASTFKPRLSTPIVSIWVRNATLCDTYPCPAPISTMASEFVFAQTDWIHGMQLATYPYPNPHSIEPTSGHESRITRYSSINIQNTTILLALDGDGAQT